MVVTKKERIIGHLADVQSYLNIKKREADRAHEDTNDGDFLRMSSVLQRMFDVADELRRRLLSEISASRAGSPTS